MVTSGVLPSVASQLQLQYGYTATESGLLLTLFDIVGIVVTVPIGYYGARYNKARVTAWGFVISTIGVLLFVLPMAVLPKYSPSGGSLSGHAVCSASAVG